MQEAPSTNPGTSWILDQLNGCNDARNQAYTYVLRVYSKPLQRAYAASRFELGDAEDIVQNFFHDRIARGNFLHNYSDRSKRLGHWLWIGFRHYCHEQLRAERRWSQRAIELDGERESAALGPDRAFDQALRRRWLMLALDATQAELEREGADKHWQVFALRTFEGLRHAEIETRLQLEERRSEVMYATTKRRIRKKLEFFLARDGVQPERMPLAIQDLLEA